MKIALVDKHPIFRTGVRAMLAGRFGEVTTFETGSIHYLGKTIRQEALDIVIIGLSEEQPDINPGVLKRAIRNNATASFILYASGPCKKQASAMIRMGVRGILTKNSCPEELLSCIRAVIEGELYICLQVRTAMQTQPKYTRVPKVPGVAVFFKNPPSIT